MIGVNMIKNCRVESSIFQYRQEIEIQLRMEMKLDFILYVKFGERDRYYLKNS